MHKPLLITAKLLDLRLDMITIYGSERWAEMVLEVMPGIEEACRRLKTDNLLLGATSIAKRAQADRADMIAAAADRVLTTNQQIHAKANRPKETHASSAPKAVSSILGS